MYDGYVTHSNINITFYLNMISICGNLLFLANFILVKGIFGNLVLILISIIYVLLDLVPSACMTEILLIISKSC